MARRRMIDPNFWASEDVSKLSHTERLMLIGLFSTADDHGKGRANAAYIRSNIFCYEDIPLDDIEKALCNIQRHIHIVIYQIGDSKYYKFTNWRKWQKVDHPTDSLIPDPQDSDIILEPFANDSRSKPAEEPPNISKDNISKKKKDFSLEIENFRQRYSDFPDLIDGYIDILRTTRVSGKLSDSVIIRVYEEMQKYPVIVVKSACLTVLSNPSLHSKRENYFYGILRNTKADEAAEKIAKYEAGHSEQAKPSTHKGGETSGNYKQGADDSKFYSKQL